MNEDIYWERQSGGLCRKHAINAYFGRPLINVEKFSSLCAEFDKYIRAKGYPYSQTSKFDCIYSSRETVISYIIGKYDKKFCLHIPIGLPRGDININKLVGSDDFVFVYNPNHIYGYKKVDGIWYNIDSLRGVNRANLPNNHKLGYIIPRKSPLEDLRTNQKILDNIIDEGVKEYLSSRDNLGELETIMATSAEMIGMMGGFRLLRGYYSFLRRFEKNPLEYDISEVDQWVKFFQNYNGV